MELTDYIMYEFMQSAFVQNGGFIYTFIAMVVGWFLRNNFNSIINKIFQNFFYKVIVKENTTMFPIISKYLEREYGNRFRNVLLISQNKIIDTWQYDWKTRDDELSEEQMRFLPYSDYITFRKNGMLIKMEVEKEEVKGSKDIFNNEMVVFNLTAYGWKPKDKLKKMLTEIIESEQEKLKDNEIKLFTNDGNSWEEIKKLEPKSLDNIIFPKKTEITDDIDEFLESRKKYIDRGLPYKRTYIFDGPPGTGKTSFALALAQKYQRDVYMMNLETIWGSKEFMILWNSIPFGSFLLIEDMDINIGKRNVDENKKKAPKEDNSDIVRGIDREEEGLVTESGDHSSDRNEYLGLNTILNCMDGVFYREGLVTMITTNHIDQLDHALLRPGRIDKRVHIPRPDEKLALEYIENFYDVKTPGIGDRKLKENYTMSAIQEVCICNETYDKVIEEIYK